MKNLYMIRHAKSDWENELSDFERGLNKRGKNNAPMMGKVLHSLKISPDIIITSSAVRAKTTAKMIAKELKYSEKDILQKDSLYLASKEEFYKVINNLDDKYNSAMIFSHNPGITEFVESLTNTYITNIPTCGVCHIKIDVHSWSDIFKGLGELVFFDFPKNH